MLHPYKCLWKQRTCIALLVLIHRAAQAQPSPPVPQNLVLNPSLEDGTASWSLQANGASASANIDDSVSHSGKRSLRLTNASPQAPNVWYRAFQSIATRPFTTYRISCWVKGDHAGDVFIGGGPGWQLRKALPQGTFDWQEVSVEWSAGADAESFELLILTQSPTKACWIDDVRFVTVHTDEARLAELRSTLRHSLDRQKQHLQQVSMLAQQHGQSDDAYVKLGLSIARRFIDRIDVLDLKQAMSWSLLQIEEIDIVLKQTEERLNDEPQVLPGAVLGLSQPDAGPVVIRNGAFSFANADEKPPRFICFGGYGAFHAIFRDLPNFRNYGVSLIQDGRTGPSSLNVDGRPGPGAALPADGLRAAEKYGIQVDLLLSPHFFPDWAYNEAPDLRNGNVGFLEYNIDHPKAREVIEHWLQTVVPTVKDQPALFSYCLSNEPAYVQSGKDPYSRPKWVKYLRETHRDVATLNALYGTSYQRFEDVVVPTRYDMPAELNERRAYFDWCRFNQLNFADWHRWMNDVIKSIDPHAKTHAKVLVVHALEQNLVHLGVDPELFCEVTDIAGCDNFVGFDNASLTAWPNIEFYYDLLNSFRNQPVFNSELHFIPDGFPPQHIPSENSRAMLWQGALHHLGAATIWVWEEPAPGLQGSIYLRPANIYGVGRALLDANRLSRELAAINRARPRVALLYSQPSIFWEPDYRAAIVNLYSQLRFAGERVTFVSERQLAAGREPDVNVIISPRATHIADRTVMGLEQFMSRGGKLIVCGDDDLQFNQYHQKRTLPADLRMALHMDRSGDADKLHEELIAALHKAGLKLYKLQDANKEAVVSGVEYCVVNHNGETLIPIINMTGDIKTVRLPAELSGDAIDLLTGRQVNRDRIELHPMVPLLLRKPSISTARKKPPELPKRHPGGCMNRVL